MTQTPVADRPRSKAARSDSEASTASATARWADRGLIASFLALTFLLGMFPLKDTDFWWHLKTGDQIRATYQVPTTDTFTYGAEGHPWIDLHWGFQVLVSWGYELGGVVGLNLGKCAITTLAVFLLISAKRRRPVWPMLLAWLPALLVLSGRMYIRPETMSLLYLSMVLAILFRWERQPWLAFALPVVQVLWVNTQGLFLLEPILIGCALAGAVVRPGAFEPERRSWWRAILAATALTGLACLLNPYGIQGALYPIQLSQTMGSPIFKNSIAELKPLPSFIEEVGLDNLPLRLHIATFSLGGLSFLIPMVWVGLVDGRDVRAELPGDLPKGRKKRESSRAKKKANVGALETFESWRPSLFRGLIFSAFSGLSVLATRNSHQFAAVVGTVTAWNLGEWGAAIRARRLRLQPASSRVSAWPMVVAFSAIVVTIAAVASGQFYAWTGEGRSVGLGEEPLWFPKAAAKFAGEPGMPDRMVGFHNGHPSLYEYYWAPEKKTYTDARLEVMGPELYKAYLELNAKIRDATGNWATELDNMGRPALLIDNLDPGNSALSATLLNSRHWRCVWFDPIACVFVHDFLTKVVQDHEVDFAARHFRREAEASTDDPATLLATAKALRYIGTSLRTRPNAEMKVKSLLVLGLDYARKLREVSPRALDGWKQAGMIVFIRERMATDETFPRFRQPFDPVIDLSPARATYDLSRALEIAPDDGNAQYYLSQLYLFREMTESALPLLESYVDQPNINLHQQKLKARTADMVVELRKKLGATPSTQWANQAELESLVTKLLATGRPETAAEVMESAYRTESRPWEWADRLAVLRLHLGQPTKARVIWLAANNGAPAATRSARIAATYLVEGDFESARKSYREAIAADPKFFEAHYGLALLEQDAGHAPESLVEARLAEKTATSDYSRSAARLIVGTVAAYEKLRESP